MKDFRLNLEHPPLSKLFLSLPLYFSGYKGDYENPFWEKQDQIRFGKNFYFEKNNLKGLNISRFSTIFFTSLFSLILYFFVLRNFGKKEALFSLFFFIFYPDNIAHGCLATTDLFFSFLFFLSFCFFYLFLKNFRIKYLIFTSLFTALCLCTRHTGFFLFPFYFLFLTFYLIKRKISLKKIIIFFMVLFISSCIFIWASYFFKKDIYLGGRFIKGGFLPAGYIEGIRISKDLISQRLSFFLGEIHKEIPKTFFIFSFFLKTPISILILFFLSFFLKIKEKTIIFWVSFLIFFILTIFSSPVASHRYLLFLYPFVFIICSLSAMELLKKKWDRIFLFFLLTFNLISFFRFFPFCLSYTNEFIKRESIPFYFVDSNSDWGQGLVDLKNYCQREKIEKIYLSYFGTSNPSFYGINFIPLPSYHQELYWKEIYPREIFIKKGEKVGISITNLSGLYQPVYFGEIVDLKKPEKIIGGSIYIYTSKKDARFEFQENSPLRWKIPEGNMLK